MTATRAHRVNRAHIERRPPTHTAATLLGTTMMMPRSPRHERVLAESLYRLPSFRMT
jgi:hypothetical protein